MFLLITLSMLLAVADTLPGERVLPEITSESFIVRTAEHGLERTMNSLLQEESGPAWVGWAAPVIAGNRTMCCWQGHWRDRDCCGRCLLDRDENRFLNIHERNGRTARLERSGYFFVMVRFERGRIDEIRSFSDGCELDAGRRDVYWLDHVEPAESVEWLAGEAVDAHDADDALTALALHDHPAALKQLGNFVGRDYPEDTRETAAFWLGSSWGRPGYEILAKVMKVERNADMREEFIFAISQSEVPEAVDTLIDLAREDRNPDVRSEAIFWLAQEAADRAVGVIEDAIKNDPETEVKRRAVFALSQTPDGVTLLIDVARKNRNPAVRREAIFWLGQSDDPRAFRFIESILNS